MNGLIPAMAIDAMYYRDSVQDIQHNVQLRCADMHRKGYPTGWWQPLLRYRLSQWGAMPEVLNVIQ